MIEILFLSLFVVPAFLVGLSLLCNWLVKVNVSTRLSLLALYSSVLLLVLLVALV